MVAHDSYRILFSEIINGKTAVNHSYYKKLYIKHFSYLETGEFDEEYNNYLESAKSEGIPTYKEREEYIIKTGLWSKNKELDLLQNQKVVSDMRINISKDYLYSRRKMMRGQIVDIQKTVDALLAEKNFHIGSTAESHANKLLTLYRLSNSFFHDVACKCKLFELDTNEVEDEYYSELISIFNAFQTKFNSNNITRIAISPFFTALFYLSTDNPYTFYGKPMIDLTAYQVDLFGTARHFKQILSTRPDIPKEIYHNPEELMEWLEINDAADKSNLFNEDNSKGGAMSIPGATKEDLKMLGATTSDKMDKVTKKLREKGQLNAEELFNLTR